MNPRNHVWRTIIIGFFLVSIVAPARASGQLSAGVEPAGTSLKPSGSDSQTKVHVVEAYGKLPLAFEANEGQADARVKFLSRGGGYTLFLTNKAAVLELATTKRNQKI